MPSLAYSHSFFTMSTSSYLDFEFQAGHSTTSLKKSNLRKSATSSINSADVRNGRHGVMAKCIKISSKFPTGHALTTSQIFTSKSPPTSGLSHHKTKMAIQFLNSWQLEVWSCSVKTEALSLTPIL